MDYNKIYINSSNIIDNLESMYYKTDNIKLKNKILYEINKYKKHNKHNNKKHNYQTLTLPCTLAFASSSVIPSLRRSLR